MTRADALAAVIVFCLDRGGAEDPRISTALRKLQPAGKRANGGPSERGLAFADWFRTTLPTTANLSGNWRSVWARCFDAMRALDGRSAEDIFRVCKWARGNDFWRGNFLSPAKLRARRDGVQFFDRFAEAMKTDRGGSAASRKARKSAGEYGLRDAEQPPVFDPGK